MLCLITQLQRSAVLLLRVTLASRCKCVPKLMAISSSITNTKVPETQISAPLAHSDEVLETRCGRELREVRRSAVNTKSGNATTSPVRYNSLPRSRPTFQHSPTQPQPCSTPWLPAVAQLVLLHWPDAPHLVTFATTRSYITMCRAVGPTLLSPWVVKSPSSQPVSLLHAPYPTHCIHSRIAHSS